MPSPIPPNDQPNASDGEPLISNSMDSDASRPALAERADRFNMTLESSTDGFIDRWPRFVPIGLLLVAFVVWAFVGRFPVRASGRAVILVPRSTVAIQPRLGGRVVELNIQPGDEVSNGQLVALMESPEQTQELQNMRDRLADLEAQDRQIAAAESNRNRLGTATVTQQRQANQQQIEALQDQLSTNQSQRVAFLDHLRYLRSFQAETDQRIDTFRELVAEGVVPPINFQAYFLDANQLTVNNAINEVQVALEELDSIDESIVAQMGTLEAASSALLTESSDVELVDTLSNTTRSNLIADQRRAIAEMEVLIQTNSEVVSPTDGRVETVTINTGEIVLPGGSIGQIIRTAPEAESNVVALFEVGEAKQLAAGMTIDVVPDSFPRERYGSMVAEVVSVGERPVTISELANLVGSRELALKLFLGEDERDPEMPQAITAVNILVELRLDPDPDTPSGYRWTASDGPAQPVTDGTTAEAHVVVEERALIEYLVSAFRAITGIYRG
ncbi:NHLP bacteriocin system secretion protein [Nodosilinea sp. P-1105]|uniref:NHLP bacteriocin system secretion protein n=1 Tax=Nodosilinea sp. P-1105 TaxID=2546229 RepID=UPI00146E09C8|nr:NHLP bacteriocin system secretion protein [Nodosilinea sp. P-1105]NMF85202.1 NHLP bacteriocin system secretion protein [Nodosilinea sp. P-1105]